MTLFVDIRSRLGDFTLDARFESAGGLTALFGPSGAGKTSLIHIIAGLRRPDAGRVAVDGVVLVDTETGVFIPKHRRRVGYVFQEGRLFPHLTVRQNLLYGAWFKPKGERRGDLNHIVEMLGLSALLRRRPGDLSGGEKQRVAIGRALLAAPRILLMDEPLASLDEARKAEIFPYIERLRDETKTPIIYVSHSVREVARLATSIVMLSEGRVTAAGPAGEVMGRTELFPEGARAEAGALIPATVAGHDAEFGLTRLDSAAGALTVPRLDLGIGAPVRARVRARDVMIALDRPENMSALNVLAGTVAGFGAAEGPVIDVRLDCNGQALTARITRRSVSALDLTPGRPVFAVIKSITFDDRSLSQAPGG